MKKKSDTFAICRGELCAPYISNKRGITLVALVITIIVLLILAGVAVSALIGTDGILSSAENAVMQHNASTRNEESALMEALSSYSGAGETIEEIKTGDTVTVRLVADGAKGTFYLPVGFYYVGGTVSSGVVISDNAEDEKKYAGQTNVGKDLVGNQYVWIPADGRTIVFALHDNTEVSWPSNSNYSSYTDWKNKHYAGTAYGSGYENYMDANITSVAKYRGFYIGRYEAGWDTVTANVTRFTRSKSIGDSKIPVSKAGYAAWNNISQVNASIVCDRLNSVEGYENVTARLIDGIAWDTTVEYISDAVSSITNSNSYGNYSDGTVKESNLTYRYALRRTPKEGGSFSWINNNTYYRNEPNEMTLKARTLSESSEADMALVDALLEESGTSSATKPNYTYRLFYEIVTGGVEGTKVKNIYDLAGNMGEWTSEVGGHGSLAENSWTSNEQTFNIRRGGSLADEGKANPVSYRNGNAYATSTHDSVGFRTVLYVK